MEILQGLEQAVYVGAVWMADSGVFDIEAVGRDYKL